MSGNRIVNTIIVALCLASLPGCASATAIPLEPCEKPVRVCTLGPVQLESIFSYSANKRELRSLIIAVGKDHGFTIHERYPGTDLPAGGSTGNNNAGHTISFVLREKSYLQGLKTIHSSAILAEIHSPSGEILYQVTWINDGKKTLDSMSYLRKALHRVFRTLGHKALHPQPL